VSESLTRVALYRRRVRASALRVWENVRDWEHLPWLHASSFRSIELEDSGPWGWRAAIALPGGGEIRLELVVEGDRYVSRTLEGPGAGVEIWTTVTSRGPEQTDIEVEFQVPGVDAAAAKTIGDGFVRLYTRLWDEDESMMRERTRQLRSRKQSASFAALDLGPREELTLPMQVELAGQSVWIVEIGGELVVYAATCPHWLGPLGACTEDGRVTCPWHGYRFDIRSGKRCDADSPMRLLPAPRLDVRAGRVWLLPS
jgi:nitrite reductase/ring-hydroxylating ferredoxin subunit